MIISAKIRLCLGAILFAASTRWLSRNVTILIKERDISMTCSQQAVSYLIQGCTVLGINGTLYLWLDFNQNACIITSMTKHNSTSHPELDECI